jgi:hypothetical protein
MCEATSHNLAEDPRVLRVCALQDSCCICGSSYGFTHAPARPPKRGSICKRCQHTTKQHVACVAPPTPALLPCRAGLACASAASSNSQEHMHHLHQHHVAAPSIQHSARGAAAMPQPGPLVSMGSHAAPEHKPTFRQQPCRHGLGSFPPRTQHSA